MNGKHSKTGELVEIYRSFDHDSQKKKEMILFDLINKIKEINSSHPLSDHENLLIACLAHISKIKANINPSSPLSVRQILCLVLLGMGYNPEKCADFMGVSVDSIRTYEQRIRGKLGANNRTHAFYLALEKEIISITKN